MPPGKVDPDVRSAERYGAAPVWEREREAVESGSCGGGGGGRSEERGEESRAQQSTAQAAWLVLHGVAGEETSPRITMPRFGLLKPHAKPPNLRH